MQQGLVTRQCQSKMCTAGSTSGKWKRSTVSYSGAGNRKGPARVSWHFNGHLTNVAEIWYFYRTAFELTTFVFHDDQKPAVLEESSMRQNQRAVACVARRNVDFQGFVQSWLLNRGVDRVFCARYGERWQICGHLPRILDGGERLRADAFDRPTS